jgi:DNA repair exonuclease SbcCD nuclease subunit
MFKFIHAADIHLDSPLRGLSRYESAPVESIRSACRRAFINLIDLAIEEQVAFVLLVGDIYDGDWKDYSTGIFFSQQIGRLGQHNIQVYAVLGNHDAANKMTKALESPANLHILSHKKVEQLRIDELSVLINGQSFGKQHIPENLANGFPLAEKGVFNIGLLHTSLDGREGHAVYAPCTPDDLHSKGYQYWALGHVHKQEFVSQQPWIVFPGCIQGRHIRETGAKGCVLVSVDSDEVTAVEPVALDVLRWELCRIDVSTAEDLTELLELTRQAISQALEAADGRTLAIRIRLEGASKIADELAAYPEQLEQQIKALGAEMAGGDLWIERIENTVAAKLDLDSALADDSTLARLLQDILSTRDAADIEGMEAVLNELRQKIPAEALSNDSALNLGQKETLKRLIEEAKQMLIGRLLVAGAEQ